MIPLSDSINPIQKSTDSEWSRVKYYFAYSAQISSFSCVNQTLAGKLNYEPLNVHWQRI